MVLVMVPAWLHVVSVTSLTLGLISSLAIAADEWKHPQKMPIMNAVWPLAALFGTVVWLWGYFCYGRHAPKPRAMSTIPHDKSCPGKSKPFIAMVAEGASHCGSGCTLGDICAEWLAFGFPVVAVWLGWQSLFSEKLFAVWGLDFIFAFAFGIIFQYFTIAPMRHLSVAAGIWAAVKADTLSLTAWQVGMYGFMAVAYFVIFRDLIGVELKVNSAEFWFMMQIAMIFGFITSFPVNWWLLRSGLKEKM